MNTVDITKVIPDKNQPRKYFDNSKMASLKDSIKRQGIVSPLIVEKTGDHYTLIDGERRFRAAQELKLKTVPIQVVTSKDPIARLIEQFHIQEQHEPWSQSEKAQAILELAEQTGQSVEELCALLSIPRRTARIYMAFAKLAHKDKYAEYGIPTSFAEAIVGLKTYVKSIKEKELEQPFSVAQSNKFELSIIKMMKGGELTSSRDFSRVRDSIKMNPKLIDKLTEGSEDSVSDMFIKSKAKSAYHLRNAITSAGYTQSHIEAFLNNPQLSLTKSNKDQLKRAKKAIETLIAAAGDDGE